MAAKVLSENCQETDDWSEDVLNFDFQIKPIFNENETASIYSVDKLTAGCCIIIEGQITESCSGFVVNLRCSEDIALHINPRFDQNYIARNAKINRVWGPEESQMQQKIPLVRGEVFTAELLVGPSDFMISVNGMHLFSFAHRLPYSDVKAVEISSEVIVSKFTINQLNVYPSIPASLSNLPIQKETKCPVIAKIGQMQVGDVLEVTGRVHSLPHSFFINLQGGSHFVPHPIISYHLVARYLSTMQIVQNSWSNGKWNEEIVEKLPSVLLPGETFRLAINCLNNGFTTEICGKLLRPFHYRVPLAVGNTLLILGDLTILSVKSSVFVKSSNEQ